MVLSRLQLHGRINVVFAPLSLLVVALFVAVFASQPAFANAGVNQQLNYQARLLQSTGAVVPDGTYNIEFKIYQDGDGVLGGSDETLKWTEQRINGDKVTVTNGYFSVQLGSVTAFSTNVDWNQDTLWLSLNIGGTGSPSWDGEMSPFRRLAATAYALNTKQLGGLDWSQFVQVAPAAVQTDTSALATLFLNKNNASGNILQLQKSGSDVVTIANGGVATFQGTTSATGFRVLDASAALLTVDTAARGAGGGNLVKIGNSTGTDAALTIFQVDSTTADPSSNLSALNGGLFYNSTSNKLSMIENGAVKVLCNTTDAGCGAGGGSSTLQGSYDADVDGSDAVLALTTADDSIIFRNPASSGSDSGYVVSIDQLNTGAVDGLRISTAGTGNALRIDDVASDNSPFIVDADGRVGVGTTSVTGTTERLLQVGSPTNRGNAAVYGELVSKGMRDLTALTNIKDIFVYDTTADSDGGRWIDWATTDKMSWYNEALDDGPSDPCNISTDDRCYSQNFPRRAILVVTTNALYIFDGQTNTLWMKFSQNAAGWGIGVDTNNDPSSVAAINGVIYVGTNGSAAGGLYVFDFTADRMWNYDDTDRSAADVGIGSRNSAVVYNSDNITALDLGANTGWKTINDVSATVINGSNTPIAATTGPNNGSAFVALATDSGVNLINMSHQRLFQYSRITDDNYSAVAITKTAKLYALDTDRDELNAWTNVDSDQANQVNTSADKVWDETTSPALTKTTPNIIVGAPDALEVVERGSLADSGITAGASQDLIYVGTDQGLTELHDHATVTNGWVKYYNTTRQTGIMPASVRRAHMLEDASGNVTNQSNKTSIMAAKGTPTYGVSGVRGKAMAFNGTSQYLCSDANADATCDTDATDAMGTGSWTVSAWFKHSTTISGTDVLFARCYNTTPAAAAGCVAASMTSTGTMAVNVDFDATWTIGATGTTVFHNSTQTYNDNQWHQLTVTRAATTGNINTMIDGKPIGQTAGLNTTLDASQIFGVGTDCSTGAACATGGNFWDGQIDDFIYNSNGVAGTTDNLPTTTMRRLYNDARPLVGKKVITVTDATAASSTSLTDSGEAWTPQELAGLIVTITGGTGAGQSRHVVSNTATSLTVSPAFTTAPDTTSDFEVDPEALYGASDSVRAIGITAETPLGEARQMCVGTNGGTDGGGVTCYNHNAGPNLIADIYHADAKQIDDSGTEWTGGDYDDIQSIDLTSRALVVGTEAQFWTETEDVKLGQGLDYLANKLFDIRSEILNDGISTVGSLGAEVGLTGGADLAERYTSEEPLLPGHIVSFVPNSVGAVKKSTSPYQKDVIGIVATQPGLILGPEDDHAYPIALVGRVPVNITAENGPVKAGDRIVASSLAGYGMRATQAGRVLGAALDDVTSAPCPADAPEGAVCGQVTVFVNLVDYGGQSIELAIAESEKTGLLAAEAGGGPTGVLQTQSDTNALEPTLSPTEKILRYLASRKVGDNGGSEVLADRVSAVDINGAKVSTQNLLVNDGLAAGGTATFNGDSLFYKIVTFVEKAVFKNDVSLEGHLLTGGSTPTVHVAPAAGMTTVPSGNLAATATTKGNDTAGQLSVTFGQDASAGKVAILDFAKPYASSPMVLLTPANSAASAARYYVEGTQTGFELTLTEPLAPGATVLFNYWVVQ